MSTLGAILRAPTPAEATEGYGAAATRLRGAPLARSWGAPLVVSGAVLPAMTELERARELVVDRLLAQMKAAGQLERFVQILVEPLGRFRDVAFAVRDGFEIGTAIGSQLDMIGSVLGQPREGFDDTRYRVFLNIVAQLLLGVARADAAWTGTCENVLTIARRFVGPEALPNFLHNTPPYAYTLTVPGLASYTDAQLMARFLRMANYAAVSGFLLFLFDPFAVWNSSGYDITGGSPPLWGTSTAVAIPGAVRWGSAISL